MRRIPRDAEKQRPDEPVWKSEPGEPPIKSSGDLLAMMVQGGQALADAEDDAENEDLERRTEERAAEPPPRKAIVSVHGKDVEEIEIPESPGRRRAA